MTYEKLRLLARAVPFHPFTVRLPSGKELAVPNPDVVAFSPNGRLMVVLRDDGSQDTLDVMLIESVQEQLSA